MGNSNPNHGFKKAASFTIDQALEKMEAASAGAAAAPTELTGTKARSSDEGGRSLQQ